MIIYLSPELRITNDRFNYVVETGKTGGGEKNAGKMVWRPLAAGAYWPTLQMATDAAVESGVADIKAEGCNAIIAEVKALKRDVFDFVNMEAK